MSKFLSGLTFLVCFGILLGILYYIDPILFKCTLAVTGILLAAIGMAFAGSAFIGK